VQLHLYIDGRDINCVVNNLKARAQILAINLTAAATRNKLLRFADFLPGDNNPTICARSAGVCQR